MASSLLPYEGYDGLGRRGLASLANGANSARVRLFANNLYPTQATSWSEFVEAVFAGYAAQTPGIPTDEGLSPLNIQIFRFPPITFTMASGGPAEVYGYWIDWINPIGAIRQALWIKRFLNPFVFTGVGSTLKIILTPGFRQGN